jgi:protein-disulfide isomerase
MSEHIRGNPKAPVVLVEYADFECPYCAMAYPYTKDVVRRFHDQLAYVFRPFPLVNIHPHAMHAAQAAEAAGQQNKFWEMHDLLFENQRRLDDRSLMAYAASLGLDMNQFERDFASRKVRENIERSMERGISEGVNGTPTFILNGMPLALESYDALGPVVAQAIAESVTAKSR